VDRTFRFSTDQFARMHTELLKRMAILKGLAPWPDPNYAIDESWAAVDPYGSEARDGDNVTLRLRILNHSPQRETYRVKWTISGRAPTTITLMGTSAESAMLRILTHDPSIKDLPVKMMGGLQWDTRSSASLQLSTL
jgi:hypothetical protein